MNPPVEFHYVSTKHKSWVLQTLLDIARHVKTDIEMVPSSSADKHHFTSLITSQDLTHLASKTIAAALC